MLLAVVLYFYHRFLLLVMVVIGITALTGIATDIKYRGWLFFGVPVIGLTIAIVIGKLFF